MKVNTKQLVEVLSREIMKSVSRQIREMVAYEIDIERKRLRKQIMEEVREQLGSGTVLREDVRPVGKQRRPFQNVVPQKTLTPKAKRYDLTGNPEVDQILSEIKVEEEVASGLNEVQDMGDGFGQPMVSQEDGDAINFDPKRDDPTQMDWSAMVEAVDQRAREKRKDGSISLPQ